MIAGAPILVWVRSRQGQVNIAPRPSSQRASLVLAAALLLEPTRALAGQASGTREDRLRADVARLAAPGWQGRRAGTAGADQAAEWIAAEFRRIGLAPAGGAGSYFQHFTFVDGVDLGPGNRLAASSAPPGTAWKSGEDFRPLAFSSPGAVEGEVVFVGYGIVAKDLGYDDYAGVDARGRVVLVLRYGPDGDDPQSKWSAFSPLRLKVSTARDQGAKAVLVVTGARTPNAKDELVPLRADASLSDAGIPAFTVTRAVAEAFFEGSGSLGAAQKALDETGRPAPLVLGGVRLAAMADLAPRRSTTRNVLGVVQDGAPGREAVVVGAHYDHLGTSFVGSLEPQGAGGIHPGADDNASGVAALLELARGLSSRSTAFQRSVLFVAFGAEEQGALGSSYFVKNPPIPIERVAAMVNMDMVGRLRGDKLEVHGVGTSPRFRPLVDEANRSAKLELNLRQGGYGSSDHSPFYATGKPVLFLFTGVHPDYHRSSDTADKVNAAGIARVLELVEGIVAGLVTSAEPVAFTRVAGETQEGTAPSRGLRVWVGAVPDYSAEGGGVTFSGVSPGSPAEKAGILAGDVLVRFGPKEIRNIYDYTYALGEHKPGETVAIVVLRGGNEVSLEVTLGSRPSATR